MARFEVYSKNVLVDGDDYILEPLSGEYLPIVYSVIRILQEGGSAEDSFIDKLSEQAVKNIHLVCYKTFEEAYPDVDKVKLGKFVSRNIWAILPIVVELNIVNSDDK